MRLRDDAKLALEDLAERWGCSQTAVVERAIQEAHKGAGNEKKAEQEESRTPPNCTCLHCGERFVGAKYATICPSCRGRSHQNLPVNCEACHEGLAI